MLVRQQIGHRAGEIVEMKYAVAMTCVQNATAELLTDAQRDDYLAGHTRDVGYDQQLPEIHALKPQSTKTLGLPGGRKSRRRG